MARGERYSVTVKKNAHLAPVLTLHKLKGKDALLELSSTTAHRNASLDTKQRTCVLLCYNICSFTHFHVFPKLHDLGHHSLSL